MQTNEYYMKRAFELAAKGRGSTNPNPMVGAVIVKHAEIISEGYHITPGYAHAEVTALGNTGQDVRGGVLYCNLEPCSHFGRTPPCVDAIIDAGIKEVVIGMIDPNPKVAGNGVKKLREAGIKVTVGVLEEEAIKLNEIFIKYITKKQPFVILKTAMTLDGKIATRTGNSKWITGESARRKVHYVRNSVSSIMVGINTVLKDDPMLTVRVEPCMGKKWRIVVDSKGIIPIESAIVGSTGDYPTILATTSKIDAEKERILIDKGIHIIKSDIKDERVDLAGLMNELYKMEIDSILLEGGGILNASALEAGIVDKVMFFISPKIIGGEESKTPVEGPGVDLNNAVDIKNVSISQIGGDILVEGYVYV